MNTFISKLYIRTNSLNEEKICVGLYAVSESFVHFDFSKRKLHWMRPFLEKDVLNSLERNLKSLRKEIRDLEKDSGIFRSEWKNRFLSPGHFNYLNTYSAGLMAIDKPHPIALELNLDSYLQLFRTYVDEGSDSISAEKKPSFKRHFSECLKRPEFDRIDKEYTLSPKFINSIYLEHKVDFIGKNGALLAGFSIDFNTEAHTIERHLIEFASISRGLNDFSKLHKMKGGNYYAFFSEPSGKEARSLLDRARADHSKGFELREIDYLDVLAPHLEREEFSKFSAFVNSLEPGR
ncbi:hypothetical protein [Croceimicrobium hydrocarbonivorans]|uniref:DUF3037 domain-containing protein n=1 Tax=Croceimicrobium hydrocarbonivorans TaxID=2761580 RepID=A0A7H0VE31_9FLAO|nr:hypothetical protein [Croceimicrobium hydrocarbonivorans]QNR23979.1 hypothetical protein H4K34_16640 [Croceimicrobium hydrocarbonivorans]